ncbi:MAG: lysophospholipase [Planctomycetaceae bacterium]
MRRTETELVAVDSTPMLVRRFSPDDRDASRTVLIVHGLCEHGERYEHVARCLIQYNWNVVVPDLRGHGRSGGVNTHVVNFRHYAHDLEIIFSYFRLAPESTAIVAHSMGGLVALRFAQLFPDRIAALVMTSPLLGIKVSIPRRTIATGKLMSLVAPRTRFRSRVNPVDTTRNPEALAQRLGDPLIRKSVTAGWYFAMRSAMAAAWDEAKHVQLPLFIMQAGADRIVDPDAPAEWVKLSGSNDVTLQTLPEHYHELLNEPDWQQITASIAAWLDRRVASTGPSPQQQSA